MFRLGETPVYFDQDATQGSIFEQAVEAEATVEPDFGSSVWGVPEDVRATTIVRYYFQDRQRDGGPMGGADRYEQRANTALGEDILQSFDSMDSNSLYSLQLQLLLTGFDTRHPDKVLWGQPDPKSYQAFARAVGTAARSGRTLSEVLNAVQADDAALRRLAGSSGGGGGVRRTNVIQHMAEEDLEKAALVGFQTATGHAATPEQEQRFITAWRQREASSQPDTGGGGTFNVTDPGNPTVVAEASAREQAPEDAQAYSRLQKFGVMLQALGVGNG